MLAPICSLHSPASCVIALGALVFGLALAPAFGQNPAQQAPGAPMVVPKHNPVAAMTVHEKWHNFVQETVSPITIGASIYNAGFAQITNSDPKYGTNAVAFGQRFGASVAGITSQNLIGDFAVASAFHEDPRYFRMGPGHTTFHRAMYAISRAVIIRTDSGGETFNWDNILGSAGSAGLAWAYWPAPSRTTSATILNFVTSAAGSGFVNLYPEFWPDFRRKVFGHHR